MKSTWRTHWEHNDIVVYRDEAEVDRLPGDRIARVCFVYRGQGDTPGDIVLSVVELTGNEGYLLFEPNTGFAGRVNFERQSFWSERRCVYWVPAGSALLPWRWRLSAWRGDAGERTFRRVARDELAAWIDRWPLVVPQTWEDRKRRRLSRLRPFGYAPSAHA